MKQNYVQYRSRVIDLIEKRLGGKPKFAVDEDFVWFSFGRRHLPSVVAEGLIERALEKEREKAK